MVSLRFGLIALFSGLSLANSMTNAAAAADPIEFAIAIHGGAGIDSATWNDQRKQDHQEALGRALEVGRKILADGGTSLDAVERTIRALEDDPRFNAGRGAVFNSEGRHELDASIMDGKTGAAGAVGGVTTVKNPISLARLVMTQTRHVLLVGDGAEKFADELKGNPLIERVPNGYFDTEERRQDWLRALEREKSRTPEKRNQAQAPTNAPAPAMDDKPAADKKRAGEQGTVGCVALDKHGNLAAGTSTGGVTNKKWGRVGDSPIIGAGTYANNATCAVSCTGTGEYFIKHSVAFHVSALMAYKGLSLDDAVRQIIEHVLPADTGGIIAVDHQGRISMRQNTPGMARACVDSSGRLVIELGK